MVGTRRRVKDGVNFDLAAAINWCGVNQAIVVFLPRGVQIRVPKHGDIATSDGFIDAVAEARYKLDSIKKRDAEQKGKGK